MTTTDQTRETSDDKPQGPVGQLRDLLRPALLAGLALGLLYGGILGMVIVFTRDDFSWFAFGLCLVAVIAGIPIVRHLLRKYPSLRGGDPDTPRTRRMGMAMLALMAFAAVMILPFVAQVGSVEQVELYSNGPIPMWLAIALGGAWAIGMPTLAYLNRRNMDELERSEMKYGETLGFQFFAVAAPVWWIAWRGGIAPQPDVMILFAAVLVVSLAANIYRKVT